MNTSANAGPVSELTYAQASAELDAIVAFFEGREVDVDQLVERLERAEQLFSELDRRLRQVKTQVDELAPRLLVSAEAATLDVDPDTGEIK